MPVFYTFLINKQSQIFCFWVTKKAGDGNRTHVSSLEGWCSTIELHPRDSYYYIHQTTICQQLFFIFLNFFNFFTFAFPHFTLML